ncbi:MAG: hypothetical protein ACRDQ1_20595, partial [Sciscionella sp.]
SGAHGGLSVDRLITQLEMTTLTAASGRVWRRVAVQELHVGGPGGGPGELEHLGGYVQAVGRPPRPGGRRATGHPRRPTGC